MLIVPLVVKSQQNAAKMNNNLPQMQALQLKMTEARQTGNQLEGMQLSKLDQKGKIYCFHCVAAARMTQELMSFMKDKEISPFKNLLVPLAQVCGNCVRLIMSDVDQNLFADASIYLIFCWSQKDGKCSSRQFSHGRHAVVHRFDDLWPILHFTRYHKFDTLGYNRGKLKVWKAVLRSYNI